MKKILILLSILLALTGCTEATAQDATPDVATAATVVAYNGDTKQLEVSSIILHAKDSYYGIEVNDAVNYCNANNYFTTSKGLTVALLDDAQAGVNDSDTYTSIQELEEGIYLMIQGEKELVEDTFNHVFKTNEEIYQMFSHDINFDWTNEVVITKDVISFSNDDETIYIYQNPGSLSPGCYKGKIEPTVFYKQLRGIDIPITYPEIQETKDVEVWNIDDGYDQYAGQYYHSEGYVTRTFEYTPYGPTNYEHQSVEGYTPYSAYDLSKVINKSDTQGILEATDVYNYIILSTSDENILSLFNNKNNRYRNYLSLNQSNETIDKIELSKELYDLSSYKDIAKDIINSENRYHFGIIPASDGDQTSETYYIDAPREYVDNINVWCGMYGMIINPTMKIQEPVYEDSGEANQKEYAAGSHSNEGVYGVADHGSASRIEDVIIERVGEQMIRNCGFSSHEYIIEGDYIYYLSNKYQLKIYKNIATDRDILTKVKDRGKNCSQQMTYCLISVEPIKTYKRIIIPHYNTESCEVLGANTLIQQYNLITQVQY